MPLETDRLAPRHPRRDPDLPHIMRLRRRWVPIDQVLQLAGKDLAVGVARDAGRRGRRQDNYYGPVDVPGDVRGDPALVLWSFLFRCRCRRRCC